MSELILLVTAEMAAAAGKIGLPLAVAAYRTGSDGRLCRRPLPPMRQENILFLAGALPAEPARLAEDIRRERAHWGYGELLYGGNSPPTALASALPDMPVWSGEEGNASGCGLVMNASDGTAVEKRFRKALAACGSARVMAWLPPMASFFSLPVREEKGRSINGEQLARFRQLAQCDAFDPALCCRYLLGEFGAVLYDDARSLAARLTRLRSVGVERILLPYEGLCELFGERELRAFLR